MERLSRMKRTMSRISKIMLPQASNAAEEEEEDRGTGRSSAAHIKHEKKERRKKKKVAQRLSTNVQRGVCEVWVFGVDVGELDSHQIMDL
ncbi:hypothetical protein CRUP_019056 [Coryphaenoides rupestris]|nr:hypothetical protein CRUP_019056 [Coryphaenoides rupestris]